jgi:hypothetical protein
VESSSVDADPSSGDLSQAGNAFLMQREEIALGLAQGDSIRSIGLDRSVDLGGA